VKKDLSFLMAYLRASAYAHDLAAVSAPKPVITISRQMGALGTTIGEKTAEYLTQGAKGSQPWIVVDKDLTRRVMEDHHLSEEICGFLSEEQAESARERVQHLLGMKPAKWTAVEKMAQTMMNLAQIGNVIFIGRAGNIVTENLPQARHIRLVGAPDQRVKRTMEARNLSRGEAESLVRKTDYDRAHFVSNYFRASIEDPRRYHLVINTDRVSVEKAVALIVQLLPAPFSTNGNVERLVAHVTAG